jgi:Cdc6-like AAA superfamily ATPase
VTDTLALRELGLNHVRGMLLYGPPGCGKTLIARLISESLTERPVKIVNGPELLDRCGIPDPAIIYLCTDVCCCHPSLLSTNKPEAMTVCVQVGGGGRAEREGAIFRCRG